MTSQDPFPPDTLAADITTTLQSASGKRWKKVFLILVLIFLLLGAGYYVKILKKSENAASPAVSFKTAPAVLKDIVVTVNATGTLEPTNQVEVGSELSGTVREVLVDYNGRVRVGQVLARLDVTDRLAQVRQKKAALTAAKASVLQAEATVEETRLTLENLETVHALSRGKVPSKTDMDVARAAHARALANKASADAGVEEVQATLDISVTELSKADILSPVNGVVLTRNVEEGQTVAASLSAPVLFLLAEDLAQMELHVDVDEADIGQVRDGQEASFTVDAYPDRKFAASIRQVRYNATTTDGVVTYETVLTVDNHDLSLRPGMTATADITVSRADQALTVPAAALRFTPSASGPKERKPSILSALMPGASRRRPPHKPKQAIATGGGRETLWILGRDDRPRPVPVKAGLTDGVDTQILEDNIKPGTRVILSAQEKRGS